MATVTKPLVLDETVKEFNRDLVEILDNITLASTKAAEASASASVASAGASSAYNSAAEAKAYRDGAAAIVTPEGLAGLVNQNSDIITELNGVVKGLIEDGRVNILPDWTQGSIRSDTGKNVDAGNRIRTGAYYQYYKDLYLTIPVGYKVSVYYYKADKTFVECDMNNQGTFVPNPYRYSNDITLVRYVLFRIDNEPITPPQAPTLVIKAPTYISKNTNEERIAFLENGLKLTDYWKIYLDNKISAINTEIANIGYNGMSFAFITDVHVTNNVGNSPAAIKYIMDKTPLANVIQGGDILEVHGTRQSAINFLNQWVSRMNFCNCVNVYGNHDNNSNGNDNASTYVGEGSFYRICNSKTENNVSWVSGKLYGFRDNHVQKIREIYLDTKAPGQAMDVDEEQLNWLKARINELELGWSVICFAHGVFSPKNVSDTADLNLNGAGWKITSIFEDCLSNGCRAEIIGVISGHTHRDFSKVYSKSGRYYLAICTTCDAAYLRKGYDPNSKMIVGTPTEQAFDVFCINTNTKTIKAIRIGDGNDREWNY